MNQQLTVYVLPGCANSTATTTALDNAGVTYRLGEVVHDEQAVDLVLQLGYTDAPIVTVGAASWSGHRPDKIRAIVAARAADHYFAPVDPMDDLHCDSCQ